MRKKLEIFGQYWMMAPARVDALVLSLFVLVALWNPFYLHQEINLFELGLYLPGIDGVLQGQIPFKDFFYLRSFFDLYLSAFVMKVFGENVSVLCTYFYVGTVITMIACVWLARAVIPSRLLFYMFVPVLVARTFPRVVFTFWGGMRYAWGILAILCLTYFLKRRKNGYLIAAGVLTTIGALTSIEIGVCIFIAACAVLCWDKKGLKPFWIYITAAVLPAVIFFAYLAFSGALYLYLQSQWVVATQMTKVFLQTEPVPSNLFQALRAMIMPSNINFRQMTPAFCYMFFALYLYLRHRRKQLDATDWAVLGIAVYGFMIYLTGFRNLWASVFEMSLQPEKIVMFYLLARLLEAMGPRRIPRGFFYFVIVGIVLSSLIYSGMRFSKKMYFHKDPMVGLDVKRIDTPRLSGMTVPVLQASDLLELRTFVDSNIPENEKVWMFPEAGALHFILHRPWVGRFPMVTMTWLDERWFNEYMKCLNDNPPRYAIVDKETRGDFEKVYFLVAANRVKFDAYMKFLEDHYQSIASTPSYNIYVLR